MQRTLARRDGHLRTTITLSPREREILHLIADDLSNREIAEQLHLAEGTIRTYVSTMTAVLGVRSRVGLCAFGLWHPSAARTGTTELASDERCPCPVCVIEEEKAA